MGRRRRKGTSAGKGPARKKAPQSPSPESPDENTTISPPNVTTTTATTATTTTTTTKPHTKSTMKPPAKGTTRPPTNDTAKPPTSTTQLPLMTFNSQPSLSSLATKRGVGLRRLILIACTGYFLSKELQPLLLPYGTAVILTDRPSFKAVDFSNDKLMGRYGKLSKIYERLNDDDLEAEPLLKGPETVVFNPRSGTMYVLTEEALLVSLTDFQTHQTQDESKLETTIVTAKATKIVDLGMGRPLGGRFTADGKTIYIADALLGLIRVVNPHEFPKAKVELIASQVIDNGNITKIMHAADVTIGPKTGKVYFTDGAYTMRVWLALYSVWLNHFAFSKLVASDIPS
jgi:hypothetical protein